MVMKPILFNTDMVKAIMEGRKTVTRRIVKPQPGFFYDVNGKTTDPDNLEGIAFVAMTEDGDNEIYVPPYQPGDVLYVRETWRVSEAGYPPRYCTVEYKAGGAAKFDEIIELPTGGRWKPSIHMPKTAARLFLRVTEVRPERLLAITADDCEREGACIINNPLIYADEASYNKYALGEMRRLWDSTINPADLFVYGWYANPWVWVIEFERCDRPEVPDGG